MNSVHNDTPLLQAAATALGLAEPMIEGHEAQVFERAADGREALLERIGRSREHVYLDAALLHTPGLGADLLASLLERCAAGVPLQVFTPPLETGLLTVKLSLLRNAGATVNTLPRPRGSLLRQLLVADSQAAWWGPGLCTTDRAERAPHVCMEGPVVQQLQRCFAQSWPAAGPGRRTTDGVIAPAAPACGLSMGLAPNAWRPGTDRSQGKVLVSAIDAARWRVFIGLGQQLPPQALVDALASASRRGVAVSVLMQHSHQQDWRWRQCCSELLNARAWVYHGSGQLAFAPHCTVDGQWSCLAQGGGGESPALVVRGEAFAEALDAACQTTVEHASLLDAHTLADDRLVHQLMRAASGMGALFGSRAD